MSKGNLQVVGELVHKYPVAFKNCRLHGTRRNHVPVGQGAAENHHQDDEDGKTSVFAPSLEKTPLHIQSPILASLKANHPLGRTSLLYRRAQAVNGMQPFE